MRVPEPVDAWWERRRASTGRDVPYAVGRYFHEWHRYPVLVRQYHSDLNRGIVLSQVPLSADVWLQWQCDEQLRTAQDAATAAYATLTCDSGNTTTVSEKPTRMLTVLRRLAGS